MYQHHSCVRHVCTHWTDCRTNSTQHTNAYIFYFILVRPTDRRLNFCHSFRCTRIAAEYRIRGKQNGMHCKESVWVTRNSLTQTSDGHSYLQPKQVDASGTQSEFRDRPKIVLVFTFWWFFFFFCRGWCATACWNGGNANGDSNEFKITTTHFTQINNGAQRKWMSLGEPRFDVQKWLKPNVTGKSSPKTPYNLFPFYRHMACGLNTYT